MKDWIANHLPESIIAAFASLVGWLAQRAIRKVDAQEERIRLLERDSVTKETIDGLRESVTQQNAHNQSRTEDRLERIWQRLAAGDR